MDAKPADFFIGVADLFAIILPGALLSYLALEAATQNVEVADYIVGSMRHFREGTAQGWVAFALSSYLLGHFASLIGAFFLDPFYGKTFVPRKKKENGDRLFYCARRSRNKALGLGDDGPTPYKWARMSIRLRNAGAMQEIDRLEADSKFFRSLTVVLVILAVGIVCETISQPGTIWGVPLMAASRSVASGVVASQPGAIWRVLLKGAIRVSICIIFARLSFWRFSDLRWKAAEAAYLAAVAPGETAA
jgi:hypothetical protein